MAHHSTFLFFPSQGTIWLGGGQALTFEDGIRSTTASSISNVAAVSSTVTTPSSSLILVSPTPIDLSSASLTVTASSSSSQAFAGSSAPLAEASAKSSDSNVRVALVALAIAFPLTLILIAICYCNRHRLRKVKRLQASLRNDVTSERLDPPEGSETGDRSCYNGDGSLDAPPYMNNSVNRRLLHPDVIAPLHSIRTISYEDFVGSDTQIFSNEKTSPPSSSMLPTAPTFTDSQVNRTQESRSTSVTGQTAISSTVAGGEAQVNVEVLRRQFEHMQQQMVSFQSQMVDLTKHQTD